MYRLSLTSTGNSSLPIGPQRGWGCWVPLSCLMRKSLVSSSVLQPSRSLTLVYRTKFVSFDQDLDSPMTYWPTQVDPLGICIGIICTHNVYTCILIHSLNKHSLACRLLISMLISGLSSLAPFCLARCSLSYKIEPSFKLITLFFPEDPVHIFESAVVHIVF